MKKVMSWAIRWNGNDGEKHYEHVVATTILAAINWCVKKTDCASADQIEYICGENIEVALEEE